MGSGKSLIIVIYEGRVRYKYRAKKTRATKRKVMSPRVPQGGWGQKNLNSILVDIGLHNTKSKTVEKSKLKSVY